MMVDYDPEVRVLRAPFLPPFTFIRYFYAGRETRRVEGVPRRE